MASIHFSRALRGALLIGAAALASTANASTFWIGTGANDSVNNAQFGSTGSGVSSGTAFATGGGLTGTVNGVNLERRDQGNGWDGNFAPGAPLLWNRGSGDITFTFAAPVRAAGAQFQSDYFGGFVGRVTLSNGDYFDVPGVSSSAGNNSAVFIGASSTTANISSITFHQQDGNGGNDFAVGNLQLITGGVPEPATWAMLILGFGVIGGAMRRRQRVSVRFA